MANGTMRRGGRWSAAGALLAVFLAGPAFGQQDRPSDKTWNACVLGEAATIDARIAACSRVLARGDAETPGNRAVAAQNRGRAYDSKEDYARAVKDYDEAVRLDPSYAAAHYSRGAAYAKFGDVDRAMEKYDEAIRIDPSFSLAYYSRGAIYSEKGDYDRAIKEYDEAIRLDPEDSSAFQSRGFAYFVKEDYDRAIADFAENARLDPTDSYAYVNLGYSYLRKGDHDAAVKNFDAALSIDANDAVALHNRGIAFFNKGEYDRAVKDYDAAAALSPDDPQIIANRGDALAAKGDHKRALADYEAALGIDATFRSALIGREKSQSIVAAAKEPVEQTGGGRKRALVIGVDAYKNIDPLKAAVNDSRAIAKGLRSLGYDVVSGENLDYYGMSAKLVELERKIDPGDTVFFFFSGHGVSISTRNYLLPADVAKVPDGEEALFEYSAFAADRLVERMKAQGARAVILVLDACRDNPFGRPGARSSGAKRGLEGMAPPEGVFVLFSAATNQVALDRLGPKDSNPNSVFTRVFMEEFLKPGAPIDDIAKATQVRVSDLAKKAGKIQRPAYYDEIVGRFVLR